MQALTTYPLSELKLIYRVLHGQIRQHLDLMDSQLFHDLQLYLQQTAQTQGVDVGDHGAWDSWLGNINAPACAIRNPQRETWN
ncbi:MAG: hypothetical protein NTV55_03340 [Planctomycetota bacterium]|nr:hypothetical protein [Planctomycetota bacterium]